MLAFVFSGAANFGAMQAGAVEPLLARGVRPDVTVGSSAGSLNSIYLAANPTIEGGRMLQELWRKAGPGEVGVPSPLVSLRRLVTGAESLVDNRSLHDFLSHHLSPLANTFGELAEISGTRAYAVAVELESALERVFGDKDEDELIDGAMASCAVPPYYPPWVCDGKRYLDGGLVAKLPVATAIARGATEIIAFDVRYAMGTLQTASNVLGIGGYSISIMVEAQTKAELALASRHGVPIRTFALLAPHDISFWDYTRADDLILAGKEAIMTELEQRPWEQKNPFLIRIRKVLDEVRTRVRARDRDQ